MARFFKIHLTHSLNSSHLLKTAHLQKASFSPFKQLLIFYIFTQKIIKTKFKFLYKNKIIFILFFCFL